MIIIDYPPGGLGNLLAQVVTDTIDLNSTKLAFHRNNTNAYDKLTLETSEDFQQAWTTFKINKPTLILHSFGQLHLVRQRLPNAKIIQVVVNNEVAIYMNNMYRKACEDNPNSDRTLHDYLIRHYGQDNQATRRENYALSYLYFLNNKGYHNTPSSLADVIINFDNLYAGFEKFCLEMNKITDKDSKLIYQLFVKSQGGIIDRVKLYYNIINGTKKYAECSENFDTIDHGLIAGILQDRYKDEFFQPNQDLFECNIPNV